MIFQEQTSQNEVAEKFELLLATKYKSSELAQINPTKLRQNYDFVEKLVFLSSRSNKGIIVFYSFLKMAALSFLNKRLDNHKYPSRSLWLNRQS